MTATRPPAYASVVLDVDSTLCAIEGIDVLAQRHGPEIERQVAQLTDQAMAGTIGLDQVYGRRLALIRPTIADLEALAKEYDRTLLAGAEIAIRRLRAANVHVVLVSGGIRQAIAPLAARLGFGDDQLHAVALTFDGLGGYVGFDTASPLTRPTGKPEVVRALLASGSLTRRVIAVGDGSTDAALRGEVDTFGAFVGVAARDAVVRVAEVVIHSFDELTRIVLP